jgi:trehalose 6-phosphate phosphatase
MARVESAAAGSTFDLPANCALFLDFDGTLLDIASTPQGVAVPEGLVLLLARLHEGLQGALAILTGRSIQDLDRLLTPLRLPAAGQHGAEMRLSNDAPVETATAAAVPAAWRARLGALARKDSRLLVEDKGLTIAVHFRAAPECESEISRIVAALAVTDERFAPQIGKRVIELRPCDTDKGTALLRYMSLPPFAGRHPVILGDDLTDEAAFSAARSLGGRALRIGAGAPSSAIGLASPQAVREWLAAGLESLAAERPQP